MDVDNPWQVESIEAFCVLKCPECNFDAKEEIMFENHAVENHPLSGVLFGKPIVETVNPEEILDLLIKTEPPENSFENEDYETLPEKTFETFAEDSNGQIDSVKAESYEPFLCKFCVESFSDLNDMKMHLKIHEKAAFDLTNVFETEYFENLTTLNQGGITYANKAENIQSFIETHNRIENSTTTNDKMNNITRSQKCDNKAVEKSENNKTEKKTEKKMCEKKQESKTEKKCGKKRKNKNKKKTDKKKEFVCPKKKCGKLFENR